MSRAIAAGPVETVDRLMDAINRGDLDAAVALYEPDAVLVVQPGTEARGSAQLREALGGFIAMKPTLRSDARHVTESGDVALYLGRWVLNGKDPAGNALELRGESTDVLRKQSDGSWRIVLDNPWGAQVLPPS